MPLWTESPREVFTITESLKIYNFMTTEQSASARKVM